MTSDSVGFRSAKARPFAERKATILSALAVALVAALTAGRINAAEPERPAPAGGRGEGTFDADIKPFLANYCVSCHGPDKQKGDRRFDELIGEIADDNALVDWQDILDQLNLGEMPPPKAKQPTDAERLRVARWFTGRIEAFRQARKPKLRQTVLRRMNAREYRNTIRDLLHLNTTMFDPTLGFPRDQTLEHLDNVGESLVTSGHLLERYLGAADRIVEKVLTPLEKPTVQTWSFSDGFRQQPEIDQVHGRTNGFSHITLYDVTGADKHEGAYGPIAGFKQGVPYDGYYKIKFKAEALNRQHPYDREFVGTDPDEPLRLGIVAGNIRVGPLHKPQPVEPLLAELELADGEGWYAARVWLDAGWTPRFTFPNGLMDARTMWGRLVRKYPDEFPPPVRRGIVEQRFNAIKYGKLPQIHVDDIEISGPYYDAWPPASQRAVLGEVYEAATAGDSPSTDEMRQALTAFVSRAYRRPASGDEIDRLLALIEVRKSMGHSALEAYGDAVKAVLVSPAFLYIEAPKSAEHDLKRLSAYALASRLSYFLWSSMPDQELLDLAASEELLKPEVLQAQAERMLQDPRSDALIDGLLDSWLTLRDLGSQPPDRSKFADYYRFDLQKAIREETRLFALRLLDENLSVINFLDSDWTYVNRSLARFYGLELPAGPDFERVSLTDGRRGGLLGQASVLTVTANGIDTSPVVRGVWLLDNIFGTPPSPPPPDVPPLDPDVRGAQTIREQLEKHRSLANCYDCHRKIDPPGFAIESFDAIGRWREFYKGEAKIDSAGELASGEAFNGVEEFKKLLVQRHEQFQSALVTKVLAYAAGRTMESADRPEVERIAKELERRGGGMRDLIVLVTMSETFRAK